MRNDYTDKELWSFFGFLDDSSGMNSDVWRVMMVSPIPTGLNLSAQGCDLPRRSAAKAGARATLGKIREKSQPCKG